MAPLIGCVRDFLHNFSPYVRDVIASEVRFSRYFSPPHNARLDFYPKPSNLNLQRDKLALYKLLKASSGSTWLGYVLSIEPSLASISHISTFAKTVINETLSPFSRISNWLLQLEGNAFGSANMSSTNPAVRYQVLRIYKVPANIRDIYPARLADLTSLRSCFTWGENILRDTTISELVFIGPSLARNILQMRSRSREGSNELNS